MSAKFLPVLAISAGLLLSAALICPWLGPTNISLENVLDPSSTARQIFVSARIPRVLLALLAGGALATAGVLFQALMRDALATPDTLGVSSGASLGAVAAICFGWADSNSLGGIWTAALLGASAVLAIVIGLSRNGQRFSSFTLLLAGITINSICVAFMLFLQSVTSLGRSLAITRWLMGGLDSVPYSTLALLAAFVIPSTALLLYHANSWNLLAMGHDWAIAKGIDARRQLRLGYALGSILAGAVTALTGPIGFAGLIVPHALRMLIGPDHRILLPASFLIGGAFLAFCDALGRTLFAPAELPVGVITALLGGPFFLYVLASRSTMRS
jgi:iron complex transport system permease protein